MRFVCVSFHISLVWIVIGGFSLPFLKEISIGSSWFIWIIIFDVLLYLEVWSIMLCWYSLVVCKKLGYSKNPCIYWFVLFLGLDHPSKAVTLLVVPTVVLERKSFFLGKHGCLLANINSIRDTLVRQPRALHGLTWNTNTKNLYNTLEIYITLVNWYLFFIML